MAQEAEVLAGGLPATLDALQEGIQVIDRDWRYVYVNDAVCRHGKRAREELLGHRMMAVYPGIDQTEMFRALRVSMDERRPLEMTNEFVYPDGSKGWFDLRIRPCAEGVCVLSVDVTEQRRLEARLRESQRLDAIGRLAGGVAHDFNNVLTAIKGFTYLALERVGQEHPARPDLDEVMRATDRAAGLTRQLLAFARRQPVRPVAIDVSSVVLSVEKLLRRLLRENIDIATRTAPALWRTLIDPTAFEQVLVNLAVNARDAMPRGGKLTIETQNARLDETQAQGHGGVIPPGEYVLMVVSDDGVGMAPEVQERIFEPFFTTKEVGQGTGLGLATCYGIVRQAGGHIWVYSEPGHGSTFKVFLPRTLAETQPVAPPPPLRAAQGHETILLVEDEPQVREVAARVLGGFGYRVVAAESAEAAMRRFDENRVDLLVTDLVMPGTDGRELARTLTEKNPKLRTLFISGYTEAAMLHRGALAPGSRLLDKPFSPAMLASRVRAVLDET